MTSLADTAATADARPLGQRLREDTRDLHTRAEKSLFQAKLVKGELPKDLYLEGVRQMYVVHRALEAQLAGAREADPRVAAIVTDEQFRAPRIAEDLAHHGLDAGTIEPSPEAASFVRSLEGASPLALLGMHYVMEGSNNGNRFIARAVAGAYGMHESLATGRGLGFLLPHGERQPAVWQAFKDQMAQQHFTEAEMHEVVEAAKTMFGSIIAIHEALLPA